MGVHRIGASSDVLGNIPLSAAIAAEIKNFLFIANRFSILIKVSITFILYRSKNHSQ